MRLPERLLNKASFFLAISLRSLPLIARPSHRIRLVVLTLAFTTSVLLLASIAITPVTAATIQYSFTGTVTQVSPRLSATFSTNAGSSAMSGFLTVNTTDTNTLNGNIGSYTITSLSLNIEGYTATMGTSGNVQITNGPPGNDRFEVTVNAPNGPMLNSRSPRILENPFLHC